jgi:hypothetical protein
MATSVLKDLVEDYHSKEKSLWEWLELDALIAGYEPGNQDLDGYMISQVVAV